MCSVPRCLKYIFFSRNDWKLLGIGQLKCVLCGIVCDVFYYVDTEKAIINEDNHQERELRKLVVETHHGHFKNVFSLIYVFCVFIYR